FTDDLPQRARAQALRVDEVARAIAGRRAPEAHHAVLAGVLAGHEGRPRGRGEGREGGVELTVAARRHQTGELGQLAPFHHRPEEPERRPVEPDHEYLPCHACAPHAAARARRMPATSADRARQAGATSDQGWGCSTSTRPPAATRAATSGTATTRAW